MPICCSMYCTRETIVENGKAVFHEAGEVAQNRARSHKRVSKGKGICENRRRGVHKSCLWNKAYGVAEVRGCSPSGCLGTVLVVVVGEQKNGRAGKDGGNESRSRRAGDFEGGKGSRIDFDDTPWSI
ncbi:hypothetical protein BC826DRAFT_129601 [Russula brevipes]|nr:hypothetical protein BC826DRAFT_129601 [Russula brevipes]